MTVVNADYWLGHYFVNRAQQQTSLELASEYPRHSPTRRLWLEIASHDASLKRLHWSFHTDDTVDGVQHAK